MAGLCEGGNEPTGSLKAICNGLANEEVEESYDKIEEIVEKEKKGACVILMDDWKAVVGEGQDGRTVGKYGLGKRNDRREYLIPKLPKNAKTIPGADINTDHVLMIGEVDRRDRSLPSKETLRGHSDSSFRGEGYIQCCVGVRLCDMYSNQELAEIHFMYGKADGNAALARRLYQERYPQRQCPDRIGRHLYVSITALSPADYPARVRFCQWFLQQCGVNPNFPALVLFTDEAQFTRDGITNFHNQHVWAYENPRATVPSHHQVRFSLNMWAGIIGDRLVGPHKHHVLEDTPLINRRHIHFLHDGAPAHFSRTARRYLDRRFPDRGIGRGGPIAWPPRSPDPNPLDFYLWGHLKSLVYSSPVPDLESLRNRIVACSEDIRNTPGVWDRVRRSMRHRCEASGRQHSLKWVTGKKSIVISTVVQKGEREHTRQQPRMHARAMSYPRVTDTSPRVHCADDRWSSP
ncbi:hypothetical protein ANN_18654 [Periplaneta americana]|uniref:Uncharacterized protein n=1 Tax=Periplaneta americana TaxID=6978 RepID=A0ABQ8SPU1_PERAM|nr:hypothetical protein ANN_18654 [Periplaneta americana]